MLGQFFPYGKLTEGGLYGPTFSYFFKNKRFLNHIFYYYNMNKAVKDKDKAKKEDTNILGNFIWNVSNPTRTLIGLDEFVEDHKDAIFWYGHIGIPDDEIYKIILEEEQDLVENADFYLQAINVFEILNPKKPKSESKLVQEHEESIAYFREKVAPYL